MKHLKKDFQETLKYKQQFGKANTKSSYKTSDGYKLGIWQSNQKTNYKNGKLENDKIKKLEDIGFIWGAETTFKI